MASGLAGTGTRFLHALSRVGQQFGRTFLAKSGRRYWPEPVAPRRVRDDGRPRRRPSRNRVRPRASGAQLPAPGLGLGQRRSYRRPRLSDSYHGSALVMLAARLLLEAGAGPEPAAGTPWLCGAARDTRRLGHPRAGEARTRALSAA